MSENLEMLSTSGIEQLPNVNYYMPGKIGFFNSMYPDAATANGVDFDKMVRISDEDYASYITPPDGKYLVFDEKGPRLESIPAPDYQAEADYKRTQLLAEMQAATYTLNAKLLMGRTLTASESARFNAWLDYSDALSALDMSAAPNIEWPTKPA